ncbi:MAG TPA: alpha/beta hydrolase [Burkholderiales bacterium]|nr:alpha/beta hydrolase [Burkholderiales bacterium]
MTLHPQAQAVLDALAAMKLPTPDQVPVSVAREQFLRARASFLAAPEEVAACTDRKLPGPAGELPVRVYRPRGSSATEPLPALVFFHGGGWVFGNLDSHDPLCRALANRARCAVVAVDYRLAPENKFPAAVEDALAALRGIARLGREWGIDAARLAAAGDSAGGNLVAVAAIDFRDSGGPQLALQVLLYPVTDLAMTMPSYERLGQGYMLTRERMLFFRNAYLRDARDIDDWRASPLKVPDLSRLPPALIITASHDPLVDEAQAYADRLAASGVPVTYRCYDGMIHGFLTMAGAIDAGRAGVDEIAGALRRAFG